MIYNFAPGPATLPAPVLKQVQAELLNCRGGGVSVMELSHRGALFKEIAAEAEADLRELLTIPDNYAVLFMQGGATLHASAMAMNLAGNGRYAAYADTGHWSKKAITAAEPYINIGKCADAHASGYTDIVPASEWRIGRDAAYVHYTANETISGVEYQAVPDCSDAPLVTDATSNILSRPLDVSKFGLIYAGAQKNIGPAGMTVIIVRRDLLGKALRTTPRVVNYTLQDDADSMVNTPPTWSWYVSGLVFKWLKEQGGLAAIETANRRKATRLYDAIDGSGFYSSAIAPPVRSIMNVTFRIAEPDLEPVFVQEAEAAGLLYLKGHRSVGGLRASLYNAMPEEGVVALTDFMRDFEIRHG